MDRSITTPGEAPLLRLSTELYRMIAEYLEDPRDLAALVNCCKTCMLVFGKDWVHIQSAKQWALEQAGFYCPSVSTLQLATMRCIDKDVFIWILDLFIKHYPQCLNRDPLQRWDWARWGIKDGLLDIAIWYGNKVAVQAFLDRGVNIPRFDEGGGAIDEDQLVGDWHFPLTIAFRAAFRTAYRTGKLPSMNILRSLLDAGHCVIDYYVSWAVAFQDTELFKDLLKQALEHSGPVGKPKLLNWRNKDIQERALENLAWLSRPGLLNWRKLCREGKVQRRQWRYHTLQVLIQSGSKIIESPADLHRFWICPTTPVCEALRLGCPQNALLLQRHQRLQKVYKPFLMRQMMEGLCQAHSSGRSQIDSLDDCPSLVVFIKRFHPEFTAHLCSPETFEGTDHNQKWREGCEFLVSQLLQYFPASHEVVKYLLDNGCTVPTA